MIMCLQSLVSFCHFALNILSKHQILTSIKGRYCLSNLRKTKIYNINVDFVNDNVFTKLGLILSFRSHYIEQTPNSDVNQRPLLCCKFAKKKIYNINVDLVNDYVYTKFGLNMSIRFQDIEQKLNSDVNQGPQLCCKFADIRTHPSFHACPRYLQE